MPAKGKRAMQNGERIEKDSGERIMGKGSKRIEKKDNGKRISGKRISGKRIEKNSGKG